MKYLLGSIVVAVSAIALIGGAHIKAVNRSKELFEEAYEKYPDQVNSQFDYIWENLSSSEKYIFDKDALKEQVANANY